MIAVFTTTMRSANTFAYVGGNPISYVDALGLWSVTVEGYAGFGAESSSVKIQLRANGFYGGRIGVGVSGTLDPMGKRPSGDENPGCGSGTTVGGYGSLSIGVPGIFQWNPLEFQGGYEFGTGKDFSEPPAPGPVVFGTPGHFEIGGAVGIQVIGR